MKSWVRWAGAAVLAAGWAPLAVFSAHVLASRVVGLYLMFPTLDRPMHLFGGAAIAYFFQTSLRVEESEPVVGPLTATATSLMAIAATGTTTALWEFAEWLADRYLGTHAQRGLEDTLLDMSLGLAGGLLLIAISALWPVRQNQSETPGGKSAS